MSGQTVLLPAGFRDAKLGILIVSVLGEVLQGGLFFGWNALAIMIQDLGNYSNGCTGETICKSQETSLALIWTVGIFALNCGPVVMGFVLDYLGPKFTAILGVFLNMVGLLLFGFSASGSPKASGINAFIPAAIILGLGNITFHLAQFHISALYPRHRGLVSSIFVAGFTGCGIIMYLLLLIFQSMGRAQNAYKGVLVGYAGICALWVPLMAWMMPSDSFKVGMVYLWRRDWRFETRQRSELERMYRRTTMLQDFVAARQQHAGREDDRHTELARSSADGPKAELTPVGQQSNRLVSTGLAESSDPIWFADDGLAAGEQDLRPGHGELPAASDAAGRHSMDHEAGSSAAEARAASAGAGPESMPLPPDVVWGPLVFEARRFVELRKKSFSEQFWSSESFGMGIFYTMNVFMMQFYLGTMRLQLEQKGDDNHSVINFGNIIVAFAFVTIPLIGWLLDKKGYGLTLGTINALGVLTSVLQALPVLQLQRLTIVIWMVARFFMYSSYFAIFGGLFGFRNFGRLVAIDNTFNGLFGLLQYPLTSLGIHKLNGDFMWINISQAVVLLPLFAFCYYMFKWEREDLVPIRPMEGEELPCDMVGDRTRKHVHLPHFHLPDLHLPSIGLSSAQNRT